MKVVEPTATVLWPTSVEGWVGLVLALFGIVSVLLVAINWVIKIPLQTSISSLTSQLNKLERDKVGEIDRWVRSSEVRFTGLEQNVVEGQRARSELYSQLGALRAEIHQLRDSAHKDKQDIINVINRQFSSTRGELHQLEIAFAAYTGMKTREHIHPDDKDI